MGIKKTQLEIKQAKLIAKFLNKNKSKKRKNKNKKLNKPKTKSQYLKELKSEKWHKIRLEILKKDNFTCQKCGNKNNLQVHHVTYIENKKAWQYPDNLLITLCEDCHRIQHNLDKNFN